MKIWKGPELEGTDKGTMTMFVSGSTIDCNKIIELLIQNQDCKRVYLGGGRIDVEEVVNFQALINYCNTNKLYVVCECGLNGLTSLPQDMFDNTDKLIVRIDHSLFDMLSGTDLIKIDSGSHVHITTKESMIVTDLKTLNKDMFDVDILLLDESEEK